MIFDRPRSFKIKTWTPECVVITGAYWGWSGLLFPIALFPFFFSKWMILPVLLALGIGLGTRFQLRIDRDLMILKTSLLGFTIFQEVIATDTDAVEYGFDWDRINPPDVLVGGLSIGDESNAVPLLNTIKAAIAHVSGDNETRLAHLGLATPVTNAPTSAAVDVARASDIIERYQKMGLEVLMVRGWTSQDAQRVSLYVISEKCILVFDAYIQTAEIEMLEALRPTPATDDEMALTSYRRFVWTSSPFRLWQAGTPIARLYPDVFWSIKDGDIPRNEIVSVRGWVSKSWLRMGVDLQLKDRRKVQLAHGIKLSQFFDLFYDGVDLLFDMGWVDSISRTLAQELNVTCIDDSIFGEIPSEP